MSLFREALRGGADAQLALGRIYLTGGSGLKRDTSTALYWLRKAAANGNGEANGLLGTVTGGVSADKSKAVLPGGGQATESADVALADWLLTGQIAQSDEVQAIDVLRRAAVKGERKAQLRLAVMLQSPQRGSQGAEEAYHWLKEAAVAGSRAAAIRLADWYWENFDTCAVAGLDSETGSADPELLYRRGIVMAAESKPEAAHSLSKAALREHVSAQLHYGLLHASPLGRQTTGVPHSLKKTAYWLEKASHHGCSQASFELYGLFRLRQFSLKNAALAQKYLETAAQQGHAHAQYLCGLASLRDSVSRNSDTTAAGWILRASRQGHLKAQIVARLLYSRTPSPPPEVTAEQSSLIRLVARTRIALATRLELGQAFGLTIPELLFFDPCEAIRDLFIVQDARGHCRRARRRILGITTQEEAALLERARRLLDSANLHPTDVRGTLAQRSMDLRQTIMVLVGQEPSRMGWKA